MEMDEAELLESMNEHQTRKVLIDPELERRGWHKKYVKEEVNPVKSDFNKKNFVFFQRENIGKGDRYIDYVVLNEDYSVLAIIESKRYSKNEEKGRIQARTYAKDIEQQVHRKIPIFLTNGNVWRFIDEDGIERKVSGPFSQEDLRRRRDLYEQQRDPVNVKIDPRIVDRPKSVQIVKELSEHFSRGHRKALVHMATGTGKTRVAMAIIKVLMNANIVRNVLFIADRTPLVDQAESEGFKQFFTEPVADLRDEFSVTARLYVSTIQTLMSPKDDRLYERFSPGFFDLIVFDEAHRSYYDKNNVIQRYFDAIMIGLTATPREHEARSTFEMFDCEFRKPTVEYSYDEAVRDGVLVRYRADIIGTEVLADGISGSKLPGYLKDQLRRQEVDPEITEFTGSDFDRIFMDDTTNAIVIVEFMNLCYKSDEGKPCKTIFFCASQAHARHIKRIFGKLYPNLGSDVQVITSNEYRAGDEIKRFKKQSEPRIALSVGMLDTGVDIPEVCNLVFVKPVFSHIRFWQMVGRGTRNLESCRHREWLPEGKKNDFYILDFKIGGISNIKLHEFTESREREPSKGVTTRIFENRVKLMERPLDEAQRRVIYDKIMASIDAFDEENFMVREKLPTISRIKENAFNLRNYVKELMHDILPLVLISTGGNPYVSSFILKTESLFRFILDKRFDKIEDIRQYVEEMALNILSKDNLYEINQSKEKIIKIFQDNFWDDLTFEDVEFMIREIAPLMKYYEPVPRKVVQVDKPDVILDRETFEKEVKQDERLREFIETNPIMRKLKNGEGLTPPELKDLERQLIDLNPHYGIESVQRYQKKDFVVFLREIIGISREDDPKAHIEKRFNEYIIANRDYNVRQLEFLTLLKKVFSERKWIELPDFAKDPLREEHPLDYFEFGELENIVKRCNEIKIV